MSKFSGKCDLCDEIEIFGGGEIPHHNGALVNGSNSPGKSTMGSRTVKATQ